MKRCAPAISVAIGSPRVVTSRAQPPDVALIGPVSSEVVKTTGAPDFRGIVLRYSDAGETSYPAACPSGVAARDWVVARAPALIATERRKMRRFVLNMMPSDLSLADKASTSLLASNSAGECEVADTRAGSFSLGKVALRRLATGRAESRRR